MTEPLPNEATTTTLAIEPTEPTTGEWNPPVGDEDFDSLFNRVGADGENLADSNAIPADQTTESAEPAIATKTSTPEAPKFELKTSTGTVYKTPDDAIKGIEQKDQLINQLRSMVAAATGEDPLSKSGIKPGPTTAPAKPVSYLQDRRRFAQDLTKAAELGQRDDSWDPYGNVLGQYIYEIVQSAVGPYMPVVQSVGKQQALAEVAKGNPAFQDFYNSPEYHKVLEERPKLAQYIQQLEGSPTAQEDLREMYQSAWDHAQAKKLPELARQHQQTPNPTPRMPSQVVSRPSLQVPDRGQTVAREAKPSLSTPEGRKAIIEEAERRGLADVQF
jgi:hypothetical protein